MIIMKLFGLANGQSTPFDGDYLADFDFEAANGRGEITMAGFDITKAKKFANMAEAFTFYNTQPKCCPIRPDGKPNKPLTATNWSFETIQERS